MAFFTNILGFRDFTQIEEIKKFINLNLFYDKSEDVFHSKELLLFKTTAQQTWLLASNMRLFCILDDTSKDTFEVKWDMKKNELIKDGKLLILIEINPNYSSKSGLVDFGENHKRWYYSKSLFQSPQKLQESIKEIITTEMR